MGLPHSPLPVPSPPDWGGVGGGFAQSGRLALDLLLQPPHPPLPPLLLPPPCLVGAPHILLPPPKEGGSEPVDNHGDVHQVGNEAGEGGGRRLGERGRGGRSLLP